MEWKNTVDKPYIGQQVFVNSKKYGVVLAIFSKHERFVSELYGNIMDVTVWSEVEFPEAPEYEEDEESYSALEIAQTFLREDLFNIFKEHYDAINKLVPQVDIHPYAHNMIGLRLGTVDKECGKFYAAAIMVDLGLESLGWEIPIPEDPIDVAKLRRIIQR